MKLKKISTREAKTNLSKYMSLVATSGYEIIICRRDTPMAKLVKINKNVKISKRPSVGTITSSEIKYSKNCFTPQNEGDLLF